MLYNEDFGKLVERSLEYAPLNVLYKNVWYCPAPENILKKLGYKKIVDTPCPEDDNEYVMSWVETSTTLKKTWVKKEEPPLSTQRETAYRTLKICSYNDNYHTVDYMNKLWYEYSAEGNLEKASEIQAIIIEAKKAVRKKYPDK